MQLSVPLITTLSASNVGIVTRVYLGLERIVSEEVQALQLVIQVCPWRAEEAESPPGTIHEVTPSEIVADLNHVQMTRERAQRAKTLALVDRLLQQEEVVPVTFGTPSKKSLSAFRASTFRFDTARHNRGILKANELHQKVNFHEYHQSKKSNL